MRTRGQLLRLHQRQAMVRRLVVALAQVLVQGLVQGLGQAQVAVLVMLACR